MPTPIRSACVAAILLACVTAATRVAAQTAPAAVPAGVEETTVFAEKTDGYPQFRIPAAVVTPRGTLLVFAEARQNTRGSQSDGGRIHVVLRRSTDGGRTFAPLQVVVADGENTCGNPCPVVDAHTGRVLLITSRNPGKYHDKTASEAERGERTVWLSQSDDDGATWTAAREITASVSQPDWTWYATGPGIGIQLTRGPHAGRLVVPCNHSAPKTPGGRSHVIYSDDGGATWQRGGEPTTNRGNESQVVEAENGDVLLNLRHSAQPKDEAMPLYRGISRSTDGGATFGPERLDEALPDPRCQASIFRYAWAADGKPGIVLFSNPASTTKRVALTVRLSTDDAATWPAARTVWPGLAGYSSLTRLADGTIGVAYERGDTAAYQTIRFARFSLAWLADGNAAGDAK